MIITWGPWQKRVCCSRFKEHGFEDLWNFQPHLSTNSWIVALDHLWNPFQYEVVIFLKTSCNKEKTITLCFITFETHDGIVWFGGGAHTWQFQKFIFWMIMYKMNVLGD